MRKPHRQVTHRYHRTYGVNWRFGTCLYCKAKSSWKSMKEHIWRYHHPTFFNTFFQPEYTCDSALRLVFLVAAGVKISENPKIVLYLLPPRWFLNLVSVSRRHFMVECRTVKALKGDFSLKTTNNLWALVIFLQKVVFQRQSVLSSPFSCNLQISLWNNDKSI